MLLYGNELNRYNKILLFFIKKHSKLNVFRCIGVVGVVGVVGVNVDEIILSSYWSKVNHHYFINIYTYTPIHLNTFIPIYLYTF